MPMICGTKRKNIAFNLIDCLVFYPVSGQYFNEHCLPSGFIAIEGSMMTFVSYSLRPCFISYDI